MVGRFTRTACDLHAARLSPAARVHLGLDDHLAPYTTGDGLGLRWCRGHVAIEHRDAGRLQQRACLVLVQIHGDLAMVVPVSPRRAAGPSDRRAMIARAPPRRTKPAAASILGFIPPASSEPAAIICSACSTVIRRMGFASGVPQPSNTASTLVKIMRTSASS